ncbi:rCG28192, partial [Rattus norvegicus]
MGTRLLCCVAFCLLGAGSFVAEVTQTPRYLIKEKGQRVNMSCSPEKAHTAFYWYQQNQKKELTFLINFRKVDIIDQTDLVKKRFSAQCVPDLHCTLEIPSSEEGDSALYFCASSLYT